MMASLLDEGAGPLDDKAFQLRIEENAVELHFSANRDQITGSLRTLVERRDACLRAAASRRDGAALRCRIRSSGSARACSQG